MENKLYMKVCSSLHCHTSCKIRVPLETLLILSVYKYCKPVDINLVFVYEDNCQDNNLEIEIEDFDVPCMNLEDVPWQIKACVLPTVICEDLIITGICGVARYISVFRTSPSLPDEHEEGLLGFRRSCLQAPNESSIWTKFCEIDMVKTVKDVLKDSKISTVPKNLVRFENHLNKPIKVHNVYKLARNLKKGNSGDSYTESSLNIESKKLSQEENKETRISKNRKWKSNLKKSLEINSSTKIEDLNIDHQFAEGPFLTLADLILYPSYFIIINFLGIHQVKLMLPQTFKWFDTVTSLLEGRGDIVKVIESSMSKNCELENITLPETEDVSLYKSDPKRHNPKKRLFTKDEDIEAALATLDNGMEIDLSDNQYDCNEIDWALVPDGANPTAGHLPDERKDRKAQQLENLTIAVLNIAKEDDVIVDFCSGSGHLGILIAHLLPKCKIILLENKEQSLLRARKRVHDMGLKNIYFFQCNLDFFIGKFDIGVALHACGVATDLVLDKCLKANAKFVLCPCCYGSLHATDRLVYPRSCVFSSLPLDKYLCIGHAADQTHEDHPLTVRGARCMVVIDSDRARLAEEFGYKVTLSRLKPLSCTPKNNLLIGVPS